MLSPRSKKYFSWLMDGAISALSLVVILQVTVLFAMFVMALIVRHYGYVFG